MKQTEHLQIYDLILTTRAPLFIGNGQTYAKTDYWFRDGQVSIIDQTKLFSFIAQQKLTDRYEAFIMSGGNKMYEFLRQECGLDDRQLEIFIKHTFDARSALDDNHSLKEIRALYRDGQNQVIVPGSSIKGALRTVILFSLLKGKNGGTEPEVPADRLLNTMALKTERDGTPKNDPVNSIMRGVSVSDSMPISDECVTLVGKRDCDIDGNVRKLPLCRECIAPGTGIRFKLTLDQSVLQNAITKDSLLHSVRCFSDFYWEHYIQKFGVPDGDCGEEYDDCLILGGGAGFFSKTLTYPYYGFEHGLQKTASIMHRKFPNHKHDKDVSRGISPHTLKYAEYQGKLYPYGVCGVELQ